jgi:hypothetical protein
MGKYPFNLRLPEHAEKAESGDKQIGWLWFEPQPLTRIDASLRNVARKVPRWTVLMLDGTLVSTNCRTKREAVRRLRAAIQRRVKNGIARPAKGGA